MANPKVTPEAAAKAAEAQKKAERAKELEMTVLRRKAAIFDLIENKAIIQGQQTELANKIAALEQQIVKEQQTLNGDRKVLRELKAQGE